MADILLIHGAWQGAWVWDALAADLRARGHRVTVPDFVGGALGDHGLQAAEALAQLAPGVTAVGHSYGGCVLSQLLALDGAGHIAAAIYLDALLPRGGEALADFVPGDVGDTWRALQAQGAPVPVRPRGDWAQLWGLRGADAARAATLLRPMDPGAFLTPVAGDPDVHSAHRAYLRCAGNPNALFDRMAARAAADNRFACATVQGPHTVMVTHPEVCVAALAAQIA
ncbi:MAG: alpha/beta fold hydrolase [Pseudomonadota bacterium]